MGLLNIIRRMALREKLPIREIARWTGMSRNTIKKYLNAGTIEPLSALIGGNEITAGEYPTALCGQRKLTPDVRQEQPETHTRSCPIQSAHQSLFTDVFRTRSHQ